MKLCLPWRMFKKEIRDPHSLILDGVDFFIQLIRGQEWFCPYVCDGDRKVGSSELQKSEQVTHEK